MAGRGDCGLGAGPGAESEWVGARVSSCEGYVRGEKPTAAKGTVVTGAKKGLTPPPPADEVEAKNHDVEEEEGSASGGKSVLVRLGVAMARSGRNDEAAVALLKAVQMGDVGNDDGDGDDAQNSLDFEARENLGVVINRSVHPIARSLAVRSLPKPKRAEASAGSSSRSTPLWRCTTSASWARSAGRSRPLHRGSSSTWGRAHAADSPRCSLHARYGCRARLRAVPPRTPPPHPAAPPPAAGRDARAAVRERARARRTSRGTALRQRRAGRGPRRAPGSARARAAPARHCAARLSPAGRWICTGSAMRKLPPSLGAAPMRGPEARLQSPGNSRGSPAFARRAAPISSMTAPPRPPVLIGHAASLAPY